MRVPYKVLNPGFKEPTRHLKAGAWDLYTPAWANLPPWAVTPIPLGFAAEIPPDHRGVLHDRGSLGKMGLHVFGGLFDEDYTGEWILTLFNSTSNTISFPAGAKIVQVKFELVPPVSGWYEVGVLAETERGEGRFGSSGQ